MENRCVCCGAIIPEGRQVCPMCEYKERERLGYAEVPWYKQVWIILKYYLGGGKRN